MTNDVRAPGPVGASGEPELTVEWAARQVLERFECDEAAGYHSRDREYAITLLRRAFTAAASVPSPPAQDDDPPTTVRDVEEEALRGMFKAIQALKRVGWQDIIYCPKDGTHFDAIEAGSTGIHDANYQGPWPNGHWWVYDGDIYPSRPILFRLKSDPKNQPSDKS